MMKFEIGDKVEIVGKSVGKDFGYINYSSGKISHIHGDGLYRINGDWFALQDLKHKISKQISDEIDNMFDDLIEDL